jgi:dethiobiotin synthetase
MKPLIVTGTDTGVGKTVVSAMLTLALNGIYWKPIQSGIQNGTDTKRVAALTRLSEGHFRPEGYLLKEPLSPHRAAELDGVEIDPGNLQLPNDIAPGRSLIVEGAGGVLVPVTRAMLQIELFTRWRAPVVLVARTQLGTINHTLLSLEALRSRSIAVRGVVFVGDAMEDTERTIVTLGRTKSLGGLPYLKALDAESLTQAFAAHFKRRDFEAPDG